MAIQILSITTMNPGRVVQVEVHSYEELLQYKHEAGDITIVAASKSCSSEDLRAIIAYCRELDYSYQDPFSAGESSNAKENTETATSDEGTTQK